MIRDGRSLLATLALCVLAASPSYAFTVLGAGAVSCGKWTQQRQNRNDMQIGGWALGFVSGANAMETNIDFLEAPDADAVLAWVDNYCRSHPLDQVSTALVHLVIELEQQAGGQR